MTTTESNNLEMDNMETVNENNMDSETVTGGRDHQRGSYDGGQWMYKQYMVGETVEVEKSFGWGTDRAKILDRKLVKDTIFKEQAIHYFVHYLDTTKKRDEWIPETRIEGADIWVRTDYPY